MNHSFQSSISNSSKCAVCHYDKVAHSDIASCDCCPKIGPVTLMYGNMLMCPECITRESQTSQDNMSEENQVNRVNEMYSALEASRSIDTAIAVRTDLFNAATVAIVDLKNIIDTDESITNKPYALASELKTRFEHFKNVVFELNQQIVEAGNQQKAIQVYLNNLANSLRAEEREKLKIADINYKPTSPKLVKPRLVKTNTSKKLDKAELKKYAAELGVGEFTLQMVVVSKGITVEQAANLLRRSIAEAKSEVN